MAMWRRSVDKEIRNRSFDDLIGQLRKTELS